MLTLFLVALYKFIIPILQMLEVPWRIILSLSRPPSKAKVQDDCLQSPLHYTILNLFSLIFPDVRTNIVNTVFICQIQLDP